MPSIVMSTRCCLLALGVVAMLASAGCGGGSSSSTDTTSDTTTVDAVRLPVGDNKFSATTPQVGYIFSCSERFTGAGASTRGPWFSADGSTWNSSLKIAVQGAVSWPSSFVLSFSGGLRKVDGNGLPNHNTGTFPVASSDPAYAYDSNPNTIKVQSIAWGLPSNPIVNISPTCMNGIVGVLLTGSRLYTALDAGGRDAVAWEVQDSCNGHPQEAGAYHYHNISSCLTQTDTAGQHSALVGYAADGFGIYGNQGENGVALTNADLDICHGHTHTVTIDGASVEQYHYHATKEYPYTVGCFRGTPARIS